MAKRKKYEEVASVFGDLSEFDDDAYDAYAYSSLFGRKMEPRKQQRHRTAIPIVIVLSNN